MVRKSPVVLAKRAELSFVPKYSTAPGWTIPTRVSLEIVSAQDPMLAFSIVLLTEKNPNLDRVDVIESVSEMFRENLLSWTVKQILTNSGK